MRRAWPHKKLYEKHNIIIMCVLRAPDSLAAGLNNKNKFGRTTSIGAGNTQSSQYLIKVMCHAVQHKETGCFCRVNETQNFVVFTQGLWA